MSRYFTQALLVQYGQDPHDRESDVYLSKVRDFEYQTMMKIAYENLEMEQSVVCSAPFVKEFNSSQWLEDTAFDAETVGGTLSLVWIDVDQRTANKRLISRGANRDNWKLANWDTYLSMTEHSPPQIDKDLFVVDNSGDPHEPIQLQLNKLDRGLIDDQK